MISKVGQIQNSICHIIVIGCGLVFASCNPFGKVSKIEKGFGLESREHIASFKNPLHFSVSDSSKVAIIDERAQLQMLDQDHGSEAEFSGTHAGTCFSNGTLRANSTSCEFDEPLSVSVNDILPSLSANLKGHWQFNGNFQDSVGANHGTAMEGAQILSGHASGQSYASLTTGDDYIDLGNDSSLKAGAGEFTFSFWFRVPETNAYFASNKIITFGDDGSGGERIQFLVSNTTGQLDFIVDDDSTKLTVRSTRVVNDERWHHVVAFRNNTDNELRLFLDGIEVASGAVDSTGLGSLDSSTGNGALIGGTYTAADGLVNNRGVADYDEMAFWNTALTEKQAILIYQNQVKTRASETYLNSLTTPQYSSLVAYWKMDNHWRDSISNADGTAVNEASFSAQSHLGSHAGVFDGTNDYVTIDNFSSTGSGLAQGTISAWVNSSFDGAQDIITLSQGGVATDYMTFRLGQSTGGLPDESLTFTVVQGGVFRLGMYLRKGHTYLTDGQWHHVVVSIGNSDNTMYVDGLDVSDNIEYLAGDTTTNYFTTLNAPDSGRIGGLRYNGSEYTSDFNGRIDELGVWSVPLNAKEVHLLYQLQKQKYAGLYTSGVIDSGSSVNTWTQTSWRTPLPFGKPMLKGDRYETPDDYQLIYSDKSLNSGLVGLWHLNESAANIAQSGTKDSEDFSGKSNHCDESSSLTFAQPGKFSNSIKFDGTDDYLDCGEDSSLEITGEITVSYWAKHETVSSGTYDSAIGKSTSTSWNDGWGFYIRDNTPIRTAFWVNHYSTGGLVFTDDSGTPSNWQHYVGTYDGVEVKIYINGVLKNTQSYTGAITDSSDSLTIGKSGTTGDQHNMDGWIDEVAIWNRALNSNEISQLYQRGANRVKLQVRSCTTSNCSSESWQGPDGTELTWFSEANNCNYILGSSGECDWNTGALLNSTTPNLSFTDFTNVSISQNQYFQYRFLFESEDPNATPTLPSVYSISFGPQHYYADSPYIIMNGPESAIYIKSLREFSSGSCTLTYQVSPDNGEHFYYHDGSRWTKVSQASQVNTINELNHSVRWKNLSDQIGYGTHKIKVFFNSDGSQNCELEKLVFNYQG